MFVYVHEYFKSCNHQSPDVLQIVSTQMVVVVATLWFGVFTANLIVPRSIIFIWSVNIIPVIY